MILLNKYKKHIWQNISVMYKIGLTNVQDMNENKALDEVEQSDQRSSGIRNMDERYYMYKV